MKKFMVLVMGLVSLGVMAGCDDDSKSVKVPAAVYCTPKVGHFWGVFYEI